MANAWDDFWGNLKKIGGDQSPIKSGMDAYNGLNQTLGKVGYEGPSSGRPLGSLTLNPSANRPQQQAINTSRLPGMTQDNSLAAIHGKYNSKSASEGIPSSLARPAEADPMDKLMERRAQLEAMLDEDYTGDPEIDALIEQAYQSAMSNVSSARNSANDSFAKSDANIASLSAGHVREIETKDRDAVNRISGDYQAGLSSTFDKAKGGLEADRNAELQERTAMLQRLGLQESGLGEAGQDESQAIANLTENQAGAMRQAQGYQQADLVRNTEQAQSQASAGVERRSALNSDLQKILGSLSEAEAELGSQKSQNQLQARQAGIADFRQMQGSISDSISDIDSRIDERTDADRDYSLELRKLAEKESGGGSGGVFAAVEDSIRNRGFDPAPYTQAYAEAATETFNPQVNGDKKLWLIQQMRKKNPKLQPSEVQAYVFGVENYGTDKLGN